MVADSLDSGERCAVCERPISPLCPAGGQCEEADCSAVICRTCRTVRGRTRCPEHTRAAAPAKPPRAEEPAEADEEALWNFLREARARELGFTARFRANTECRQSLPAPDGGPSIAVKDWAALRSTRDEAAQMRRLLAAPRPLGEVRSLCPTNLACRYTLRRPPLVLEAACCGDLGALARRGAEAPPVATEPLLEAIAARAREAERGGHTLVVALFALTGWEPACIRHVAGGEGQAPFVHPDLSVCLVGPQLHEVHANPTDRRLGRYLPLFRGETEAEEAARCQPALLEELLARDRAFVGRFAAAHGFSLPAARRAAEALARERDDVDLIEVEEAGPTLKWRT